MSNKIITSVNALVNDVTIPPDQINNVVCIDTQNNRIGVKTSSPSEEIDISGTLKTNYIYINNNTNSSYDISYDTDYLTFSKGIQINTDLSVNETIDCNAINANQIILINDLSCDNVKANTIQIDQINAKSGSDISINSNITFAETVSFLEIIDGSLNVQNEVSCNSVKTVTIDVSSITNINTIVSDVSFIGNVDFSGNVVIDGSLNVENGITTNGETVVSSDDRLKHNEIIIDNGLHIIRQLVPQKYQKTKTFKAVDFSGIVTDPYIIESGLIAQEVFDINDISFCVIVGNDNTPYYLNYNNIFVYGLAAIKELDTIVSNNMNTNSNLDNINLGNIENLIKSQNLLIQTLNSKITNLENRINTLEKK